VPELRRQPALLTLLRNHRSDATSTSSAEIAIVTGARTRPGHLRGELRADDEG
jgi:hypothetical protein